MDYRRRRLHHHCHDPRLFACGGESVAVAMHLEYRGFLHHRHSGPLEEGAAGVSRTTISDGTDGTGGTVNVSIIGNCAIG